MRQSPIEPWSSAMSNADITSISQLARTAGVSVETARRVVYGTRLNPSEETLRKIASALHVPASEVGKWAGLALEDRELPYEPPREASLMSHRQREAVDEVIRLFAAGNQNRERGLNAQEQGSGAAGMVPSSDPVTYADEVEEKLRRVQQSDYAPAAHPDIQDPYEGLGEESQESE